MKRLTAAIVFAGLVLSGCASVPTNRVAEGAPITYKVGDSGMSSASTSRVASLGRPDTRTVRARPDSIQTRPRHVPGIQTAPEPRGSDRLDRGAALPEFDTASVDRELYAHQRVGKTYKVFGKSYTPRHDPHYDETGIASWYGPKFHGRPTALGEAFDMHGLTAAHKTLPLNSLVHVTNLSTGKSLTLRVNDRGPFVEGRIIDLSKGAAMELGLLEHGLKQVRVQYAGPADPNDLDGVVTRMVDAQRDPVLDGIQDHPEAEAERVAEAPAYTSLRSIGEGAVAVPRPEAAYDPAHPLSVSDAPLEAFPQPVFIPLPDVQPDPEDGPLTLTIKGPIHLAKSRRLLHPEYIVAASHD